MNKKLVDCEYQCYSGLTYKFKLNSKELRKFMCMLFFTYDVLFLSYCFFTWQERLDSTELYNPTQRRTILRGGHPVPEHNILINFL